MSRALASSATLDESLSSKPLDLLCITIIRMSRIMDTQTLMDAMLILNSKASIDEFTILLCASTE
jgi:hypothetical protein